MAKFINIINGELQIICMMNNTYSSTLNLVFLNEKKYEQKRTHLCYANKLQEKSSAYEKS